MKWSHNKIKINTFSLSYIVKKFVFQILRSPVLKKCKRSSQEKIFMITRV
jgi:hypothetical protein